MPATKVQLTGGQFQDAEGNVLNLGYLKMRLNQDESVAGVGQVCSGIEIRIQLDAAGAVVAGQFVWANSDMTPDNSYYRVVGYTTAGQVAWGPNNQQVATGATFDVGTWVPNQVISWNPSVQSVAIEVNSTLTDDQALVDLVDSDTVTFEDLGSGQITAHAGASGPPTPVQILQTLNTLRVWKAVPNSGTLGDVIGFAPDAVNGSSALIPATSTATNYNSYSSSAVASNIATLSLCGITGSGLNPNVFQIFSTRTLKAAKWQAALVDTAQVRVWMALCDLYSGNTANLVADLPNLNLIGFRYSTAAGDTTWKAVCDVAGTATVVDTGISVDTIGHAFGIAVSPTSIVFQIDGTTVATITTHIPANTVRFGDVISVDNIGLTNVKTVAISAFTTSE